MRDKYRILRYLDQYDHLHPGELCPESDLVLLVKNHPRHMLLELASDSIVDYDRRPDLRTNKAEEAPYFWRITTRGKDEWERQKDAHFTKHAAYISAIFSGLSILIGVLGILIK